MTISNTTVTVTADAKVITRSASTALLEAARNACEEIGIQAAIAVTDVGGHLIAFERSERAGFLTGEVAIDKAWTAASFGLGTQVWHNIVSDPKVAQLAHRPRLVAVGGGLPIRSGGQVLGGIGISGGSADQDQEAAEIALRAVGFDSGL